jgi:hypothetical protein
VSAGHRTAVGVRVLGHGRLQAPGVAGRRSVARVPFRHVPAEVEPTGAGRSAIDLLELLLADVSDPQVPGDPVEGEAPRVAEPVGPDLRSAAAIPSSARERIVARDVVAGRARDVEPEDRCQERVGVLAVAVGVAARAAISKPDVEVAVRPEREMPAVVVRVRLVDREDHLGRPGIRPLRIVADPVARHDRVAANVRVVDVEAAVVGVVGFERESQEALLAAGHDPVAHIEEHLGRNPTLARHSLDPSGLFNNEEAATPIARVGDEQGALETGGDRLKLDPCPEGIGFDLWGWFRGWAWPWSRWGGPRRAVLGFARACAAGERECE